MLPCRSAQDAALPRPLGCRSAGCCAWRRQRHTLPLQTRTDARCRCSGILPCRPAAAAESRPSSAAVAKCKCNMTLKWHEREGLVPAAHWNWCSTLAAKATKFAASATSTGVFKRRTCTSHPIQLACPSHQHGKVHQHGIVCSCPLLAGTAAAAMRCGLEAPAITRDLSSKLKTLGSYR